MQRIYSLPKYMYISRGVLLRTLACASVGLYKLNVVISAVRLYEGTELL